MYIYHLQITICQLFSMQLRIVFQVVYKTVITLLLHDRLMSHQTFWDTIITQQAAYFPLIVKVTHVTSQKPKHIIPVLKTIERCIQFPTVIDQTLNWLQIKLLFFQDNWLSWIQIRSTNYLTLKKHKTTFIIKILEYLSKCNRIIYIL